jgi:hypothetical protein
MRRRFALCVYGYVVMPEPVHLLLSEPQRGLLADALHYLKLSFAKRLGSGVFSQKRYYDRNVRDEREFVEKLRYIRRNPVRRDYASFRKTGGGAAFVTMRCKKKESWKSSQSGRRGIGRGERQAAGRGHSWATRPPADSRPLKLRNRQSILPGARAEHL